MFPPPFPGFAWRKGRLYRGTALFRHPLRALLRGST
jgi:hypothetical protein